MSFLKSPVSKKCYVSVTIVYCYKNVSYENDEIIFTKKLPYIFLHKSDGSSEAGMLPLSYSCELYGCCWFVGLLVTVRPSHPSVASSR